MKNINERTKKIIVNIAVMLTVLSVFSVCVFAAIGMGSVPTASAGAATNPYVGGGSYTGSTTVHNHTSNIDLSIEKAEDDKEAEESKETETEEKEETKEETQEVAPQQPVQTPAQPTQPQAPVQTPAPAPAPSKPASSTTAPAPSKPASSTTTPAPSKPSTPSTPATTPTTQPTTSQPAETTPPAEETTGLTQAQLDIINAYAINKINALRASVGAGKLSSNGTLNSYAATRAQEASVLWSHTRPNGTRGIDMISSDKYRGENLAKTVLSGYGELSNADLEAIADRLVTNWINSEGHYKNLVKGQYTKIGLQTYFVESNGRYYFYTTALFSN